MIKKYAYIILIFIIVVGIFEPRVAFFAVLCMILPIVTSFFKGRYYCINCCPRGSLYDNKLSEVSINKSIPKFLRSNKFRALVMVIMFTVFGIGIKNNLGDTRGIALVFYKMVVVTTTIGVMLAFFYNHRSWCAFCPMGSIAEFITKTVGYKNRRNKYR